MYSSLNDSITDKPFHCRKYYGSITPQAGDSNAEIGVTLFPWTNYWIEGKGIEVLKEKTLKCWSEKALKCHNAEYTYIIFTLIKSYLEKTVISYKFIELQLVQYYISSSDNALPIHHTIHYPD